MSIERLQARGDRELREILLADPAIRRFVDKLDRDPQLETRRALLGSAVRLTAAMAPTVQAAIDHCATMLAIDKPIEAYVAPSPHFNAFSYASSDHRVYVGVTSSLLEALTPEELRFVVGHELGHHLFEHHDIPVAALVRGTGIKPGRAMQLFRWQRYAEISADRAGLVCSTGLEATASAFFKIASGLRGDLVRFDIDEYLAQIGDIESEAAKSRERKERPSSEWFASHPFSPLRVRAAQLCAKSELCVAGGMPADELDAEVQDLMSIMDPSYLMEQTDSGEALRRLLFAGGVLVAAAHGEITEAEVEQLGAFLGEGKLPSRLNPDALREDLDNRVEFALARTSSLRRAQVIRDLCVIALADGHAAPEELDVVRDLAARIDVDPVIVDRTIRAATSGLD